MQEIHIDIVSAGFAKVNFTIEAEQKERFCELL